jgi:hypothetical protein
MVPGLRGLVCPRDVGTNWSAAGFCVEQKENGVSIVRVGPLVFKLAACPADAHEGGKTSWIWSGLIDGTSSIGGVACEHLSSSSLESTEPPAAHANGIFDVDHVVLRTSNLHATKQSLASAGLTSKRQRDDIYPGISQLFYRPVPNGVIIEVVGPTPTADGNVADVFPDADVDVAENEQQVKAILWGVTFVSKDVDATHAFFGEERCGRVRSAKQSGRRIATLRNKALGLGLNMAIMTPANRRVGPSSL